MRNGRNGQGRHGGQPDSPTPHRISKLPERCFAFLIAQAALGGEDGKTVPEQPFPIRKYANSGW
jgi:hypothetical protein